jgi:hypothetical protein
MSTILTWTEQQRAGIAAHALMSLGLHLSRHIDTLAAPRSQRLPGPGEDERLVVEVYAADFDAWADALGHVTADTTTLDEDGTHRRTVDGLLPDSGLRVQLVTVYPALTAVTA